jgi:hypothetical protein
MIDDLLEVGRRGAARKPFAPVVQDALTKTQRLYQRGRVAS